MFQHAPILKQGIKNLLLALSNDNQYEQSDNGLQLFQKSLPPLGNNERQENRQRTKMLQILSIIQTQYKKIPSIILNLLTSDSIKCETQTITINQSETVTQIYNQTLAIINKQVEQQFQQELKQKQAQKQRQRQKFDLEQYLSQTCLALVTELVNNYSIRIVHCFQDGKQVMGKYAGNVDQVIRSSPIMNTYVVFAMLKQMAKITEQQILALINSNFTKSQLPQQKCFKFCKYIQKNYEFLSLKYKNSGDNYIYSKKEQNQFHHHENQKWLKLIQNSKSSKIKLKKLGSMQGDLDGILLQRKSPHQRKSDKVKLKQEQNKQHHSQNKQNSRQSSDSEKEVERLILKVEDGNKIKVINAKVSQQSWKILENHNSVEELYEIIKKQLDQSQKSRGKQYVSYGVPTCGQATIGGSLGKCLAQIDEYQNANQFFLDLSKTTAIYGTLSIAMSEIPILSYLIIAGAFTYTFYLTFSNEATSNLKKARMIGNATMLAFGSVGSTIGGIFLGQALIPIPFFGGFVGGIVGGFFGTKGINKLNEFLSKTSFLQIIHHLKIKVIQQKYWRCTNSLLETIGLNKKYFEEHTPSSQHQKDVHITAICFCIVSFHQSKRFIEYNQLKMKQAEQRKKFQQQMEKKKQNYEVQLEYESNQLIEKPFENEFNIVKIIDFLTAEKFSIIEHLPELQTYIRHLVE